LSEVLILAVFLFTTFPDYDILSRQYYVIYIIYELD